MTDMIFIIYFKFMLMLYALITKVTPITQSQRTGNSEGHCRHFVA